MEPTITSTTTINIIQNKQLKLNGEGGFGKNSAKSAYSCRCTIDKIVIENKPISI